MSFIQIIEYETDRPDEIMALGEKRMAESGDDATFTRLATAVDRDHPGRFVTIVEFPSYEEAMANSTKPDTSEMAAEMAALCTSGPTYRNLDVQFTRE